MSRTLGEQRSLILKQQTPSEAPEREKSELRRMADKSGFNPAATPQLSTVADAFLGKLTEWFQKAIRTWLALRRLRG
jgi:hypothetical protein